MPRRGHSPAVLGKSHKHVDESDTEEVVDVDEAYQEYLYIQEELTK